MAGSTLKQKHKSGRRKMERVWDTLEQVVSQETVLRAALITTARRQRKKLYKRDSEWFTQRGVRGALPSLLNPKSDGQRTLEVVERDNLVHAYRKLGWAAVITDLVDLQSRPLPDPVTKAALLEAVWFWRWGWVIDKCDYPRQHGFSVPHWYVRHPKGPRPGACPVRMEAARKARWYYSPTQIAERAKRRKRKSGVATRAHTRSRTGG